MGLLVERLCDRADWGPVLVYHIKNTSNKGNIFLCASKGRWPLISELKVTPLMSVIMNEISLNFLS